MRYKAGASLPQLSISLDFSRIVIAARPAVGGAQVIIYDQAGRRLVNAHVSREAGEQIARSLGVAITERDEAAPGD